MKCRIGATDAKSYCRGNKLQAGIGDCQGWGPGQIVIPKEARELFGIKPGDTLLILGEENKGLIVSRPDLLPNLADQIFKKELKEDRGI